MKKQPTKCRSVSDAVEIVLMDGAGIEIEIPAYLTIEQFRKGFEYEIKRYTTVRKFEVKDAQYNDKDVVYIKETK